MTNLRYPLIFVSDDYKLYKEIFFYNMIFPNVIANVIVIFKCEKKLSTLQPEKANFGRPSGGSNLSQTL